MDYASSIDLDSLDQTDHGHVPFVVIILKYVEAWKADHEGKLPQSYQERQELIKKIRADMRTPDEENFEEAISNVWRLANTNSVSQQDGSFVCVDKLHFCRFLLKFNVSLRILHARTQTLK